MAIRGIIFDMDGTITKSNVNFAAINREAEVPDEPILEYIETVGEPRKKTILAVLEKYEARAAETSELREGVREVLDHMKKKGLKAALLTRNSRRSVQTILRRHGLKFDAILTRDDAPPKPSPYPVLLLSKKLGVKPEELLVVGDFHFDILAGKAAGAKTALLIQDCPSEKETHSADFCLDSLSDIISIIEKGA